MRPGEVLWLLGSIVLGAAYFTAFFWYVTRSQ
jgi:quinol-cytochrome oxidoreductase complex cytochrome b subunit